MAGGMHRQATTAGNGILFEVVFKNADPRKKPGHGISLSYGGQVYNCNDTESVRSVHTIETDDEDEEISKSPRQNRSYHSSPRELRSPPTCLKKSPRKSARQSIPLLKPSPKKLKRSRTLSPSHQSRTRSILAPFSNLSRKLAVRRHSYDEGAKTKREKDQARREKSAKFDTKPIMPQNIHPGFAYTQQFPQAVYQPQFPMYHYMPFPQTRPRFGAQPMAHPAQAGSAPQFPPELQRLQDHINHVTSALAANPIDLYAKRELDRLLAERNSFLNSATKNTAPQTPPPAKSESSEVSQPNATDVAAIAEKQAATDKVSHSPVRNEANVTVAPSNVEAVPEQHHVCSGCGESRSPSFHRKHPFAKPVHNVCRKCREKRRVNSLMKRYHFCSSCGIVRSKEYHRRRGNVTAVSARSKICHKCHANGDSVDPVLSRETRPRKEVTERQEHKKTAAKPRLAVGGRPVRIESPTKSVQPRREVDSESGPEIMAYDGVSSLSTSTQKATRSERVFAPCRERVFSGYRSPEISDDILDSNQPASLDSSFESSGSVSSNDQRHMASESRAAEKSADSGTDAAESFHPAQHPATSSNPYYQPRSTRLSSPFFYGRRSPVPVELQSQDSGSLSSDRDSGPNSPAHGEIPNKPDFGDRNKSWPGDLNMPCPGSFAGPSRKVYASDGAQTPQHSPTAREHPHAHDDGERFTNGAFGKKFSSSFKPSPPTSPWASFSGPIPNPNAEHGGSKGAFHDSKSPSGSNTSSSRWESVFGSYNASSEPKSPTDPPSSTNPFRFGRPKSYSGRVSRAEFASTRGAWNINTGSFPRRSANEHVPEPIIEEPSSPLPKSPQTTPLLLEFHLAQDMSDSGVEFLTDSSSSPDSSSDESVVASNLAALTVDGH